MSKDDTGVLSQEQKEKIIAWLKARQFPRPCSTCGHNNWTLADHLVAPPIHRPNTILIGGTAYPQAMLICTNCAHTVYFNAVMMGVVSTEKAPEGAKEEKDANSSE